MSGYRKKASPATKIFVKAPLKTLIVATGAGLMIGGHLLAAATRIGGFATGGHHLGSELIKNGCEEIDSTFGK